MAWTATEGSHVFQEWISQIYQVSGTGYTGVDSDTINSALFNNTGTPSATAAVASTAYGAVGTAWATGNEVVDATNWVAGGRALAGKSFTFPTAGTFMVDATDLSGGGNVTLTNAYGTLLYDFTISGGT